MEDWCDSYVQPDDISSYRDVGLCGHTGKDAYDLCDDFRSAFFALFLAVQITDLFGEFHSASYCGVSHGTVYSEEYYGGGDSGL